MLTEHRSCRIPGRRKVRPELLPGGEACQVARGQSDCDRGRTEYLYAGVEGAKAVLPAGSAIFVMVSRSSSCPLARSPLSVIGCLIGRAFDGIAVPSTYRVFLLRGRRRRFDAGLIYGSNDRILVRCSLSDAVGRNHDSERRTSCWCVDCRRPVNRPGLKAVIRQSQPSLEKPMPRSRLQ